MVISKWDFRNGKYDIMWMMLVIFYLFAVYFMLNKYFKGLLTCGRDVNLKDYIEKVFNSCRCSFADTCHIASQFFGIYLKQLDF